MMTVTTARLSSPYVSTIHSRCSLCERVILRRKLQIVCRSGTAISKSIRSKVAAVKMSHRQRVLLWVLLDS